MGKGILRNKTCGCGSGKKYSECCEPTKYLLDLKLKALNDYIVLEIQKMLDKKKILGRMKFRIGDYTEQTRIAYIKDVGDIALVENMFKIEGLAGVYEFVKDKRDIKDLVVIKKLGLLRKIFGDAIC